MTDYKTLKTTVERILREVSQYSPGKVEQMLKQESRVIKDDKFIASWERLRLEICNDRKYCDLLDVNNYTGLPENDMKRIRVAALYLARENPNIILPLL